MTTIRQEQLGDVAARERLLDAAFGETRRRKTSERLREGRLPADGLSFTAIDGRRVVGTVRLWPIAMDGDQSALLLGPLAVANAQRGRGIGANLMRHALQEARQRGHGAVLLVGDAPYYERFGFSADKTGDLRLPGPYEPHRLLGYELIPGALNDAQGLIRGTGAVATPVDPLAHAA